MMEVGLDSKNDECKTMEEEVYWKHFSSMHFYKILPNDFQERLVLPGKFSLNMSARLPNNVSLIGPSGVLCKVQLTKTGDVVFVGEGWKEFVKTYELKENHLLLFKYKQNLSFEVLIFDSETQCEKEACYFIKKSKVSLSGTEVERKGITKESSSTEVLEDVAEDDQNDPEFEISNKSKNDVADEHICRERVTETVTPNKYILPATQDRNRTSESNGQSERSGQNNEKKRNATAAVSAEVVDEFIRYERKDKTKNVNKGISALGSRYKRRASKSNAVCEKSAQNYVKKRSAADSISVEVLEDNDTCNDSKFRVSKKLRHDIVEGFASPGRKDTPKVPKKSTSDLTAEGRRSSRILKAQTEKKSTKNVPKVSEALNIHNSDIQGRKQDNQDNGGGVIDLVPSDSSKELVHGINNAGREQDKQDNGGGVLEKVPSKSPTELVQGSKTSGKGNENKRHSVEDEDGHVKDRDSSDVVPKKARNDMVKELVSSGIENNARTLDKCTLTQGTQVKGALCNSKALSGKKAEKSTTKEDKTAGELNSISGKELNTPLVLLVDNVTEKKAKETTTKENKTAKEQHSISGKDFSTSLTGRKQKTPEPGWMVTDIKKKAHDALSQKFSATVGRKERMHLKSPRKPMLNTGSTQKAPNERTPTRRPATELEKSTVLEKALKGVTEKSFVVIMRPTCVYKRYYLNIPSEWLHRHVLLRQLKVVLRIGDKTWDTGYNYYNDNGGGLGAGWKKFAIENNLEEFDVCHFTLSSQKDAVLVLDVEIFRAVPDAVLASPTSA